MCEQFPVSKGKRILTKDTVKIDTIILQKQSSILIFICFTVNPTSMNYQPVLHSVTCNLCQFIRY